MVQPSASWTSAIPKNYQFVNYTDMNSMHDTSTYTQIRQHAMKQVGAAKRKPRHRNKTTIELFWVPLASDAAGLVNHQETNRKECPRSVNVNRMVDDKALYDSFIRSLSCKMDPFDTASVNMDFCSRRLLRYFLFHASRSPNTWTYSSSPLLPSTPKEHRESLHHTIRSALQDALLGHSLLATASARMCYTSYRDESCPPGPKLRQKDLSLTLVAVRHLQQRLDGIRSANASPVEIETVVAGVLHLGGAAFYRGDVSTARTHIKAAVELSERIGGIGGIRDPYVRGRLLSFDDLISCVELRPCLIPTEYDPGNVLQSCNRQFDPPHANEVDASPLGLRNLSAIPSELRDLIMQMAQDPRARPRNTAANRRSAFETLAGRQWFTLRLLAIRKKVLALSMEDPRANIVRVAVLMWTFLPSNINNMSQAYIAHDLAQKLQELLIRAQDLSWSDCKDIQLWCLLMGYCCASACGGRDDWFASQISRQLQEERRVSFGMSATFDYLLACQKKMLYNEPTQRPATQRLVEELFQRGEAE